ncbi:S24 family peptidase [Mesorhizobium sp. VK23B]|uniref:S24 family peptidase n=1 Tax=Mesorhizobium dulcispinae TaxID=3072316 RepID=A0ABU4XE97_9HYPH|nr:MULTISPECIES: S24 family peptidase [unclassified Mesorhizobium]MDX8466053.1 S24 family peptidase [Mesorhizobium sp. VK23B]MDX8471864.1 S24 family peptidase [Mesorhizobium sp. VK23A]MDX8520712.1 S24 family peptidase [Mesorhizobium sp. VK23D]
MMDSRHRLQQARARAGYASPSDAARALRDINKNTLISHENGNRPLSRKAAEKYGRLFNVDPGWLLFDGGLGGDGAEAAPVHLVPSPVTIDVPIVSWISAGELGSQEGVVNLSDYPTIPTTDLEEGEWIALRVDGPSMNKISPPDSIIFVNLRDKRLVTNGCYVIADETGRATYKRYRPNDIPPFQPASYLDIPPPELEGAITIIGRVKRSMIDM